jgi:PAS domain S-box-containing protein
LTNLTEDPAVNGIVANSRNVTERINDALKIKESVEQYEIVSEATSDAIYEWNLSANYVKWSKGFKVLFGHDPMLSEDVERWSNMLHPDDKDGVWAQMNAIFQAKKPKVTLEYRFQCANGTYKHVLNRGYLIYNESGEPMRVIGAMQDVTDRISYIHSLEEKNKKLSEISWLQSHVVRAPLARIMGLLELLSIEEPDEPRQRLLSHLRDSATELDQVVRDIIRKTEGV